YKDAILRVSIPAVRRIGQQSGRALRNNVPLLARRGTLLCGELYYHAAAMKLTWVLIGTLLLALSACKPTQPAEPAADLAHTATIKDIMDSMVDPSGDFLFESVA